ncbi:alpha/beta hydrolase [Roseospira goensis]|uniref:Alpha/beta hydrolase n=1 Tax=Roseospira goensis TaxID=391922 RepID=A0A7W6RWU1_9PROT|nr:alpha/beta hydrolase [Roseospira goensis]MBB4284675.1 hypothetical protein [Roseospira goensis]
MTTPIWFATNRTEPRGGRKSFGTRFHADGPQYFRVGRGVVTWLDRWDDFTVDWEVELEKRPPVEAPAAVPEMTRRRARNERPGSLRLFESLRATLDAERTAGPGPGVAGDALIFIHGFANTFDSALGRAAQLRETYTVDRPDPASGEIRATEPHTLVFSWPSDGQVQPPWKYSGDREDAAMSGLAMARALRRFLDFMEAGERCPHRIHLVAHSMGNWALRHAVQCLKGLMEGGRLTKVFDHVFLMAADEDDDCFEHADKLKPLTELARRIHVYHAETDLALEVSDKTKFNRDRLGTAGPRTFSGLDTRITAVDCTDVAATEIEHGCHQYYRLRPEVIRDVRAVLAGGTGDRFPWRETVEPGRRYRLRADGG